VIEIFRFHLDFRQGNGGGIVSTKPGVEHPGPFSYLLFSLVLLIV
jgi:hypothetical protein